AERNGVAEATADVTAANEAQAEVVTGLAAALGREVYTWTSPYNTDVVVRFRRPRAGTDELVARLLGDQSDIQSLVRRYKALLAITELDGKSVTTTMMTDTKLRVLRDRVGFVGPTDDDVYDEAVNMYVTAYEMAMYPEQIKAISEAQGIGLSSDDIKRISKNTGLERPKA
ncbi:MAG: hypothetical protein JWO85_3458, partial [Candidatus Eremiobacteraeota bacterium]|nr:hypothetical protein [Candidatus Eremiobacteraeota bacterium]